MSTGLRTSVGSLHVVDGVRQEKAANQGIFEQSPLIPARHKQGSLYILVETVGNFSDHAKVQEEVVRVAREGLGDPGSITARIRQAIGVANEHLFEHNLNAPPEQRGVAGITCVVLRERDAYVGQLGPALLCHIGEDECTRLPGQSTWLSSGSLEDVDINKWPPLGLRRAIEPKLHRLHVREGDIFVLASTSVAKLASDKEIASAVLNRGEHTALDNLEALTKGHDVSVLIVEVQQTDLAPERGRAHPAAAGRLWLLHRVSSAFKTLMLLSPQKREDTEQVEEFEAEEEAFSLRSDLKGAAESARRTLTKFGQGLVTLAIRMLPEADKKKRRTSRGKGKKKARAATYDRRWLWLALAVPLLLVALSTFARFRHQQALETEFEQLVNDARTARATAEVGADASDQRSGFYKAMALLDQALEMEPEHEELKAEKQEIRGLLDVLNRVTRLYYFGVLKEFPSIEGTASQLGTVVVHGIDVYVLDLGMERVYKYLLNENGDALQDAPDDEAILLRKGDEYAGVTVGEPLDIVWVDVDGGMGTSGLLILDKSGHILGYNPSQGVKLLPIPDDTAWRQPAATATYYDTLYVLDPLANRILKYPPSPRGYDMPAVDYIKEDVSVGIRNTVDMSIDGHVYVLHSDGGISKYLSGAPVPFAQSGLDEPLDAPSCIFACGYMEEGGHIYVADRGNERIVQFSKDGEFIQQFRSRETKHMDDLGTLFVDEEARRLYLTNGNILYLATLPE